MTFPEIPIDQADGDVIAFHAVDVTPPRWLAEDEVLLSAWLGAVAETRNAAIASLDYILCDDEYLHRINVRHLAHDTLTDIITFDLSEGAGDAIRGECYVSLPRVVENADAYARSTVSTDARPVEGEPAAPTGEEPSGASTKEELLRVMAHGLLHLCGLRDKTSAEASDMRSAEDAALYIWRSRFCESDQYS